MLRRTEFRRVGTALLWLLFVAAPSRADVITLFSFHGSDGAMPYGTLTRDGSGSLIGTTEAGGAKGVGTVFRLPPNGSNIVTLVSFDYYTNGGQPAAGVIIGPHGELYGTTYDGGPSNYGTVFRLASNGALTNLTTFHYTDGANPFLATLLRDAQGNLYGTTVTGGTGGKGTVFKLKPDGSRTTLVNFAGSNGSEPYASLIMDSSGNLYGTTRLGGPLGYGTVFKLSPTTGKFATLFSFDGTNGGNIYGNLVLDSQGNLYGTTDEGTGSVFKLNPSGKLTTLVKFSGTNGYGPLAGLLRDSKGDLFGTTNSGGSSNLGTVFEVTPTGSLKTLASFAGSDGAFPIGGLIMDGQGNLYGTTQQGGTWNDGTVFEIKSSSGVIHPAVVPEPDTGMLGVVGTAALAIIASLRFLRMRRGSAELGIRVVK